MFNHTLYIECYCNTNSRMSSNCNTTVRTLFIIIIRHQTLFITLALNFHRHLSKSSSDVTSENRMVIMQWTALTNIAHGSLSKVLSCARSRKPLQKDSLLELEVWPIIPCPLLPRYDRIVSSSLYSKCNRPANKPISKMSCAGRIRRFGNGMELQIAEMHHMSQYRCRICNQGSAGATPCPG